MKRLGYFVTGACIVTAGSFVASRGLGVSRFTTNTMTVTDTKTGLVWQRTAPTTTYSWADAQTYCAGVGSSLGGSGWRLPNIRELNSIVDDTVIKPAIDANAFPATPAERFWSSTPYANSSYSAWYVLFNDGASAYDDKTYTYYARCVR